ncbi:hypothetical protein K502DRAFT_352913 [Neoconidiobolus thromboides FSU 785]|nr:hypothetical protein K502DRAFT_352913 [Neoconidiobolus thromboides FSU 785]
MSNSTVEAEVKDCLQCQVQNIRCDQKLPECSRCSRLFVSCSYTESEPEEISNHLSIPQNISNVYKRRYNFNISSQRPLYSFRSYSPDPIDNVQHHNHPTYLIHSLGPPPLYPYPKPSFMTDEINQVDTQSSFYSKSKVEKMMEEEDNYIYDNPIVWQSTMFNNTMSEDMQPCELCFKKNLSCNGKKPKCENCESTQEKCNYKKGGNNNDFLIINGATQRKKKKVAEKSLGDKEVPLKFKNGI